MLDKKLMLMTIFLIGMLAFGAASAADNTTDDNIIGNEPIDDLASQDTDEVLMADEQTFTQLNQTINGNNDSEINLTGDYKYSPGDERFKKGISITREVTINGNGHIIDGNGEARIFMVNSNNVALYNITFKNGHSGEYEGGGAVYFNEDGNVADCNFINNTAYYDGGAVYFNGDGNVLDCNFINNTASEGGGAVYFNEDGNVSDCNFINNHVVDWGGAVYFDEVGNVADCNFTGNSAEKEGGAVFFLKINGVVTSCNFENNSDSYGGGAILCYSGWAVTADSCIFKTTSDTTYNTVTLPPTLNFDNFTTVYGSGEKLTFDLKTNSGIPITDGVISISVYFKDNDSWVGNYSCLSGQGWTVDLPLGSYYAIFNTEYAEFKPVNRTLTVKIKTELFADAMTVIYNTNRDLTVTLKDEKGNPVAGVCLSVDLNGVKEYITDQNGQVKVNVGKLTPKTYNVKIAFGGNAKYLASSANVKLTVKKATPKIIAKKKTYKAAKKTKKYTVVLKSGKTPIKKAKMALKIKGKTYKAKTNKNGKATFKIKNLTKKAKYKAKIKYKGNEYYKAVTKKVKIIIK